VAGQPTIVAARPSGFLDPEPPTSTGDVSDPWFAGLIGGALRASAHGISHLTAQRTGHGPAAVEHPINTSSVERSGLLLRPRHLAVCTRRVIDDQPHGDGVGVARHIDRSDTHRCVAPRVLLGGRLVSISSCRRVGISSVGGHRGAPLARRAWAYASPSGH